MHKFQFIDLYHIYHSCYIGQPGLVTQYDSVHTKQNIIPRALLLYQYSIQHEHEHQLIGTRLALGRTGGIS